MKPFLRWAGSKRQLLSKLRVYWSSSYRRYFEPFAGSACLFFDIMPTHALLGDLNSHLINAYRMVKNNPYLVIEALNRLPLGKNAYYRIRKYPFSSLSEAEQAAVFIYLNKFCFNGLFRTNNDGQFNVPFGDHQGNIKFDVESILKASRALHNAHLYCCDFEELLAHTYEGDFVYLDPPFWVREKRTFSEYQPNSFGQNDLQRLSNKLFELNEKGVKFLISYADCEDGYEALRPWSPKRVLTKRNIAGFATNRKYSYELIASNAMGGE